MTKIAFVGLGTMGLPMARNLIHGGHDVTGFDLSEEALDRHLENNGNVAKSAAEAVTAADFVFTMVPNASHVRAAIFDKDGILQGMSKDALLIEMSTIHPLETDAIRAELASHQIRMIDAPVGRTSMHAELGQSLVMVGGEANDIERARPLLECLGDTIIDCGGPGMGSRMKIINNFMSISLNALTAEALTLAESIGLDVDLAIEVMSGTAAGQGHMTTTYPAKVLQGDLSPAFMLGLAHKDLGLALDLAAKMHVPLPLGAAAREMYNIAWAQGRNREDWTALYAMIRTLSGLDDQQS
ncbi:MAG: sulfolactaldehyde 3-reductase [Chloroflexota bacterium]